MKIELTKQNIDRLGLEAVISHHPEELRIWNSLNQLQRNLLKSAGVLPSQFTAQRDADARRKEALAQQRAAIKKRSR